MRTLLTFAACYLLAGLIFAVIWRRRHGPLSRGRWALLILAWPAVGLMVLTSDYAEREGWWG